MFLFVFVVVRMRLVGEAVAEEVHASTLTVLGIATWGKIAFREKMMVD